MLGALAGIAVTRPKPARLRRIRWIIATTSFVGAVSVTLALRGAI